MVNPELWGSHGWKFLHYVTLDYPENPTSQDKKKYKDFFNLLQYTLPCAKCRHHLKQNLKTLPLTDKILSDDKKIVYWLIDLHNIVNESTGAKIVNRDQAFELLYYHAKFIDDDIQDLTNSTFKENFISDIEKPIKKEIIIPNKKNNNIIKMCLIPLLIIAFIIYKKKVSKQ